MMDCQQAFALLQDILDKEASQIDEKEVRAHLEKCSHCFEKFRLEESIQQFLNEKIKLSATNESKPDKLESMRLHLLNELDEIDAECVKTKSNPFGSSFKIFLSTAALVVLAGIWYLSNGFFDHQKYFIPLEQAHWATTENISQYSQNVSAEEYMKDIENKLHYSMKSSFADYALVGGKNEEIMGTEFEHVVFSNNKDYISIFISNGDKLEIPDGLELVQHNSSNIKMFDHNCKGCRLVYHRIGSLLIITASTSKEIDLTKFVPGHLAI